MSIPVAAGAALVGGGVAAFVPRIAHRLAVPSGAPPRSACADCGRPFPGGPGGWLRAGAACPCARRPWGTVLSGAAAAGLLGAAAGWPVTLAAVAGVLLVQIDMRCLRLPDPVVAALAVLVAVPPALLGPVAAAGTAVLAGGLVGSAYLLLAVASGGGLGLGDVKLAAVLGVGLGFHGWPAVAWGAVLPHLLIGPVALVLVLSGRVRRRAAVPFGPALLTGALIAVLVTA